MPSTSLHYELDQIIEHRVTPETIAAYPEASLGRIVNFLEKATANYLETALDLDGVDNEQALEDSALTALDMPGVEELLQTAQDKIDMINRAATFMVEQTEHLSIVITPSDKPTNGLGQPVEGDATRKYEEPQVLDRTQTVLYLLQRLGVDLDDTITLQEGEITDPMLRQVSYASITIPALDRLVYVCDQDKNTSFVFVLSKIQELGLTVDNLNRATKQQKQDVIDANHEHGVGLDLKGNQRWSERLSAVLGEDEAFSDGIILWQDIDSGKHFGSVKAIAKRLGINYAKLLKVVDENIGSIEQQQDVSVISKPFQVVALEDVATLPGIKEILARPKVTYEGEWTGFYTDPETGEHIGTLTELTKRFDIEDHDIIVIQAAIRRYKIEPDCLLRTINADDAKGYSYEKLKVIDGIGNRASLPRAATEGEWQGFYTDEKDRHHGSIDVINARTGIHEATLIKAIEELSHEPISHLSLYGKMPSKAYCIEKLLESKRVSDLANAKLTEREAEWKGFHIDTANNEHWGSVLAIAKKLGVNRETVERRIDGLPTTNVRVWRGDRLGGIFTGYKFEDIVSRLQK